MGNSLILQANHSRAFSQVSVHATRCAPFSSAVSARSSFNSATVRFGFRVISQLEMRRLALQHFAAAALADELAVAHLDFAPHGHDRGTAFNVHAFETIVVVVCVLGL